jgi:hypothetical protein
LNRRQLWLAETSRQNCEKAFLRSNVLDARRDALSSVTVFDDCRAFMSGKRH